MWTRAVAIGITCAGLLSAAPPLQAEGPPSGAPPLASELEQSQPAGERSAVTTGTAFTYQGQIKQNGAPINGNADLRFTIWNADVGGQSFGTSTLSNRPVSNGIFTVTLDFGTLWDSSALWLLIEVRFPAGSGNYTTLSPRQPVLAVPYALGLVPEAEVTGSSVDSMLRLTNLDPNGEGLKVFAAGSGVYVESETNGIEAYSTSGIASAVFAQNADGGHGLVGRVTNGGIAVLGDGQNSGGFAGVFARGDVQLVDNSNLDIPAGKASFGAATRQMLDLWGSAYGIGIQSYTQYNRTDYGGGFAWHQGGEHVDASADPGPNGTRLMYLDANGRLMARNGIWAQGLASNPNPLAVTGVSDGDVEFRVNNAGEVFADGTFHAGGADFAELLPADEGLEPGDALVIGRDGKLTKSNEAYQTSVVGVYSTQPGVLGGSNDVSHEGKVPLAVVGVVPTKVTAENGAILPGDLLTTSSIPGVAMKASPDVTASGRDSYPSGSIIGKALSSLTAGQGTIQVLLVAK